jgi:hypothetical protein
MFVLHVMPLIQPLSSPWLYNKLVYGNISTQALGGAFKNSVNYRGGFSAWAAAGMPVEQ